MFKPGSVYTDTGLLELEVQFVGIGKFAECKKIRPSTKLQKNQTLHLHCHLLERDDSVHGGSDIFAI